MVVQRTLTPPVGVRSSHPQPHRSSAAAAVFSFRGVAQLVARLVRDQEAVGSNPVTPTKKPFVPCPGTNGFFVLECRGFEQPDPAAAGRKAARRAVCEGAGALLFTHLTMQRQRLRCLRKKGIHPSMNSLFALSIYFKKIISSLMTVFCVAIFSMSVFAENEAIKPHRLECPNCGRFSVVSVKNHTRTANNRQEPCDHYTQGTDEVMDIIAYYQDICGSCVYKSAEYSVDTGEDVRICHGWNG